MNHPTRDRLLRGILEIEQDSLGQRTHALAERVRFLFPGEDTLRAELLKPRADEQLMGGLDQLLAAAGSLVRDLESTAPGDSRLRPYLESITTHVDALAAHASGKDAAQLRRRLTVGNTVLWHGLTPEGQRRVADRLAGNLATHSARLATALEQLGTALGARPNAPDRGVKIGR